MIRLAIFCLGQLAQKEVYTLKAYTVKADLKKACLEISDPKNTLSETCTETGSHSRRI
jgi:hypothetical protein